MGRQVGEQVGRQAGRWVGAMQAIKQRKFVFNMEEHEEVLAYV